MSNVLLVVVVYAFLLAYLASIVICALKGRWLMFFVGFIINVTHPIGASRLAKPESWWARRFYDETKLGRAEARFA